MSGRQGFITNHETYVYQESPSTGSAAFGLDGQDTNAFKLIVKVDDTAIPSGTCQMKIDPSTNGNITFTPNGSGVLTSAKAFTVTTSNLTVTAGDVITTAGNHIIGATTADVYSKSLEFRKSRTAGVITSGDVLGGVLFEGHDGTGYIAASQIISTSSGTIATNRVASDLKFYTHPDSTAAAPLRMTIASTGCITIAAPDAGTALTITSGGLTVSAGSILGLTFDTNVTAAGVTLSGTTLSADGTDADININITAKGAGQVIIDDLQLTTDLAVTEGGTGASTFTDHGILFGSGAGAFTASSVGGTGVILTGVTSNDPTWTTATYPSTAAIGDVLIATSSNVIAAVTGAATAGYVLMANGSGTSPTFQAHTASSMAYTPATGGTLALVAFNGYIINGTGCVATLPATSAVGSIINIVGLAGAWSIAQGASQYIKVGKVTTTPGVGGSIASTDVSDCISLVCIVADLGWATQSAVGNLTIV